MSVAYNLGQLQSASAFALTDAHIAYWQNQKTAEIIVNNIQGNIMEITNQYDNVKKGKFWGII